MGPICTMSFNFIGLVTTTLLACASAQMLKPTAAGWTTGRRWMRSWSPTDSLFEPIYPQSPSKRPNLFKWKTGLGMYIGNSGEVHISRTYGPEVESHEADSSETDGPLAGDPGPEGGVPGAEDPGGRGPGAGDPGIGGPRTEGTGAGRPGVIAPTAGDPGRGGPGGGNPGADGPGAGDPGVGPGAGVPGTGGPGTGEPELPKIDPAIREPVFPGGPGESGPGARGPEAAGPGMGAPGTGDTGVERPGVSVPTAGGRGRGGPGSSGPGAGSPVAGNPGVGSPGVGGPKTGVPELPRINPRKNPGNPSYGPDARSAAQPANPPLSGPSIAVQNRIPDGFAGFKSSQGMTFKSSGKKTIAIVISVFFVVAVVGIIATLLYLRKRLQRSDSTAEQQHYTQHGEALSYAPQFV